MFKDRLKELRKNRGLTQLDFAREFKISNGAVGNWESGKRIPDSDTLSKIADFFGVSVDYLLGRSNETSIDEQLSGVEFALYGEEKDLTEKEKEKILEFAKFVKSQRK